jgi:hypothetical protein
MMTWKEISTRHAALRRRQNLTDKATSLPAVTFTPSDRWHDRRRFARRLTAVTSVSPNPANRERQLLCLQSWLDIGLEVITVNTADELRTVSLPNDVQACTNETLTTIYDRPTQPIWNLLQAGIGTGHHFMLINSDIEICGDPSLLERAIAHSDSLTIGIRWNHERGKLLATREEWGLDAFLMTTEMARTVPPLKYGLGKPAWDYWIPHHFRSFGYSFDWIKQPFFFHELHPLGWSQPEWILGAEMLKAAWGVNLMADATGFRKSL